MAAESEADASAVKSKKKKKKKSITTENKTKEEDETLKRKPSKKKKKKSKIEEEGKEPSKKKKNKKKSSKEKNADGGEADDTLPDGPPKEALSEAASQAPSKHPPKHLPRSSLKASYTDENGAEISWSVTRSTRDLGADSAHSSDTSPETTTLAEESSGSITDGSSTAIPRPPGPPGGNSPPNGGRGSPHLGQGPQGRGRGHAAGRGPGRGMGRGVPPPPGQLSPRRSPPPPGRGMGRGVPPPPGQLSLRQSPPPPGQLIPLRNRPFGQRAPVPSRGSGRSYSRYQGRGVPPGSRGRGTPASRAVSRNASDTGALAGRMRAPPRRTRSDNLESMQVRGAPNWHAGARAPSGRGRSVGRMGPRRRSSRKINVSGLGLSNHGNSLHERDHDHAGLSQSMPHNSSFQMSSGQNDMNNSMHSSGSSHSLVSAQTGSGSNDSLRDLTQYHGSTSSLHNSFRKNLSQRSLNASSHSTLEGGRKNLAQYHGSANSVHNSWGNRSKHDELILSSHHTPTMATFMEDEEGVGIYEEEELNDLRDRTADHATLSSGRYGKSLRTNLDGSVMSSAGRSIASFDFHGDYDEEEDYDEFAESALDEDGLPGKIGGYDRDLGKMDFSDLQASMRAWTESFRWANRGNANEKSDTGGRRSSMHAMKTSKSVRALLTVDVDGDGEFDEEPRWKSFLRYIMILAPHPHEKPIKKRIRILTWVSMFFDFLTGVVSLANEGATTCCGEPILSIIGNVNWDRAINITVGFYFVFIFAEIIPVMREGFPFNLANPFVGFLITFALFFDDRILEAVVMWIIEASAVVCEVIVYRLKLKWHSQREERLQITERQLRALYKERKRLKKIARGDQHKEDYGFEQHDKDRGLEGAERPTDVGQVRETRLLRERRLLRQAQSEDRRELRYHLIGTTFNIFLASVALMLVILIGRSGGLCIVNMQTPNFFKTGQLEKCFLCQGVGGVCEKCPEDDPSLSEKHCYYPYY